MKKIYIEQLKNFKDAMIINHLAELDLDNSLEFYNSMLKEIFNGSFNDIFISDNLDDDNKYEILDLVQQYSSLCFYLGEFDNWTDSIEGVSLSDLDLITIKLLDNYDFLIKIAKDGGETALKFLTLFQGTDLFQKGSIIAVLRNMFYNDDILEDIIIDMANVDGTYKDFSDKQKLVLCNYPEGVLYEIKSNNVNKIDVNKLINRIGDDLKDFDITDFKEVIEDIYTKYQEEHYYK
ncbi:MAG: hypothetical protein IJ097_00980 [Bacilli bacterium]|nr:hypothetical protein [Bacilli bacterium]